jgi:hypothetical protein
VADRAPEQDDLFFCDFCGSEVRGDDVEFRLDVNDIFVFCPRCLERARELEQSLSAARPSVADAGLGLPPELLDP